MARRSSVAPGAVGARTDCTVKTSTRAPGYAPADSALWRNLAVVEGQLAIGGPDHNGTLVDASRRLRAGGESNWVSLVAWDTLAAIRADLDLLPHPKRETDPDRLDRIGGLLTSLVEREQVKDFYSVEEFASLLGKAEFTCREWCRLGRIKATKKHSGRGKHQAWAISHDELLRYRKEGLISLAQ